MQNRLKLVHLEIDPAEINKNVKVDVAVLGDLKNTLPKIIEKVEEKKYEKWLQKFRELNQIEYDKVIKDDLFPKKEKITMGEVIHQINIATKGKCYYSNRCRTTPNGCLSLCQI